jgi:hypothetical protein
LDLNPQSTWRSTRCPPDKLINFHCKIVGELTINNTFQNIVLELQIDLNVRNGDNNLGVLPFSMMWRFL